MKLVRSSLFFRKKVFAFEAVELRCNTIIVTSSWIHDSYSRLYSESVKVNY